VSGEAPQASPVEGVLNPNLAAVMKVLKKKKKVEEDWY
jgi:hypothetical protein